MREFGGKYCIFSEKKVKKSIEKFYLM